MKRIIITKIKMKNFRGASNYECNFNLAKTCIAGKNGSGKSRHFDAFLWCLTGKDTKDRKDFEVKTRINGEELHDVETSVEVSLIVDNTEVRLKRAINEVYNVPKGSTERVFKGNETSCYINDVPLAVNVYNDRVNEIKHILLIEVALYISNLPDVTGTEESRRKEQVPKEQDY